MNKGLEKTNKTDYLKNMQSEETEFKREIGLFGGINILTGIMIGSGIFYLGSYVLMYSGMNQGLALVVWGLGGLVTLLSGICYAELGAMMPKAGGKYVYLREAYGPRIAFISGISGFAIGSSGSNAALAVALVNVLKNYIELSWLSSKLIAIGMIILLTMINYVGVKAGSIVQNIFNMAKLLPIGIILIGGLIKGNVNPDLKIMPTDGTNLSGLLGMVAMGIVATLWAYEGWTNLNTVSEEIKKPKRNLPLAIIISIIAVTVVYVLFNYSIYRVVPLEKITQMIADKNYYIGTESANILFGDLGGILVAVAMFIAILGSLNGCIMVFPRTYYSMAKDGLFFKSFKKLHPKYKTPTNAIIGSMLLSSVLVLLLDLGELTELVVFSGLIFNTLIFFSVFIFRKKYPDMERPYKVWFYPASVIITIIVMIGLMINTIMTKPLISALNIVVPLIGLVIYEIIVRRKKKDNVTIDNNIE